jgi:uncharacterized protein (DUF2236 family)
MTSSSDGRAALAAPLDDAPAAAPRMIPGRASSASANVSEDEDRAGLYGPDSEAWRLNREALLLLGAGPRALLLQIAHPLVAEGVDQHSDFRADPWRRLSGTLRSYLRIVYGTTTAARAEIARLNELHRTITGDVRDEAARAQLGGRYAARDPELSLWVHATLVDSTIVAVDAWLEPMSRGRRATYYDETRPIGRAFGIPDRLLPPDLDAFERYVESMLAPSGPVHPTPTARELAGHVLHPPLAPFGPGRTPLLEALPRPLYDWTLWPAVGLLPQRQRDELGLRWGPMERVVSAWLVGGWRLWRPVLPASVRQMPQALAADRRVTGLGHAAASPSNTSGNAGGSGARS